MLLLLVLGSLAGCAASGVAERRSTTPVPAGSEDLPSLLAGDWDNNAQVWAVREAGADDLPVHVRQHIVAVPGQAAWDWTLSLEQADGGTQEASWRYTLREEAEGELVLEPARRISSPAGEAWAPLAPCALAGSRQDGRLRLETREASCRSLLGGLGAAGTLLPLVLEFDGNLLKIQTYHDLARGATAFQEARRVRWYSVWVAQNGAGADAAAGDDDWHVHRDLRIGDQGQELVLPWRDGEPSGHALRLETLDYTRRGVRLLRLSLVDTADGRIIAYAWADPGSREIGFNLGWLQAGLSLEQGAPR